MVALGTALFIIATAEADGGYFPTAWGWSVLALAWVAGLALILTERVSFGRLEKALISSLLALIVWTGLSVLWTSDVDATVLEVQRDLVYLVGVLAAVLVLRRRSIACLLAGVLAGIVWVSTQALASRLLPGAGPGAEQLTIGRLSDPIGYFNALGLLAVMGVLLALSFAVHGRHPVGRAAAAAALPILLTTAYFTFSRGAALALGVGLISAFALDRRRLTFLTIGFLVAIPAVAGAWLASREPGLSGVSAARATITDEGGKLAMTLLLLALCSAVITVIATGIAPRVRAPRMLLQGVSAALACAAIGLVTAVVVDHGGPAPLVQDAYHSLNTNPAASTDGQSGLNQRLSSISSVARVDQWRVALREYREHPWLGSGAGTWEQYWQRDRPNGTQVVDAHSLYLETLGQLGWPGLALLLLALAVPLCVAIRARSHPLAAAAFGVYVAYLVRTGIDWDWETPVLTVIALLCGVTLIVSGGDRDQDRRMPLSPGRRRLGLASLVAALTALSLIGLVGNRALADAASRADRADFLGAEASARKAVRWQPWSAEARHQLGRAQAGLGRRREARVQLRRAARMTPDNWEIWYDLGIASSGSQRARAYATAARLNPREQAIEVLRTRGYRLPPHPAAE